MCVEMKCVADCALCVNRADLFDLQPVAPDALQQVTEAGDERVLLHPCDADLPVAQLHRLTPHLLHQHALSLHNNTTESQHTPNQINMDS